MRAYTSYALRDANPSDAEAIAGIWHRGWLDAHLEHVPRELVSHRQPSHFRELATKRVPLTTVMSAGDRVLGFVTVHDDEVEQIYVDAAARGSDVANSLLQHAEMKIAMRFDRAWLAVVEANVRARRFYERNGWSDGGAFDYAAEASGGTILVPCRRYEKELTR
jgi:ribosomal protein S18 acetylase RimI-like enzyme